MRKKACGCVKITQHSGNIITVRYCQAHKERDEQGNNHLKSLRGFVRLDLVEDMKNAKLAKNLLVDDPIHNARDKASITAE